MVDQGQKTPIARSLEEFAQRKVQSAIDLLGMSLPASVVSITGAIVTVKIELQKTPLNPFTLPNVTVPIIGSEYIRLPIQPGCLGWVMSADAYLGGMSGLGGGVADLSMRPNLSMLVWSPIGNANWTASEDPNKLVLYGPNGAILRTLDKSVGITVDKTAGVTVDIPVAANFTITSLPLVPGPTGSLYNSGGTVKVSP